MRRRSRLATAALAIIAATALSACGVPSHSKPIIDGDVRANTTETGNTAPVAQENQFYVNAIDFVERGYLTAVAAQVNPAAQAAVAKAYMAPDTTWRPPTVSDGSTASDPLPVTVIRTVGSPTQVSSGDTIRLTESVQVVGVLDPVSGALLPAPAPQTRSLTFVITGDGTGYRLEQAPQGYYMIDSALNEYTPQIIYFLSAASGGGLIPDLRYLPTWQSPRIKATQVVEWILNGPPAWMKPLAKPSVAAAGLGDPTIPIEKGAFVVNLSATTMSTQQQNDFLNEVRWSLGSIPANADDTSVLQPVILRISNRNVANDLTPRLNGNQSTIRDSDPYAYAINNGVVMAIGDTDKGSVHVQPSLQANSSISALAGAVNRNVLLAAIHASAGQPTEVAFVKAGPDGRQELWLDRDGSNDKAVFSEVDLHPVTFSRPVWLTQAPGQLAVVADGRLYVIDAENKAEPVATTSGPSAPITAFSMGQDGYRIALVSGGQVSIALLSLLVAGAPALTPPTSINLKPDLYRVDAVAWESIDQLVVAGSDSPSGDVASVIETKFDGHFNASPPQLSQQSFPTPVISEISAYPVSPLSDDVFSPVMGQTTTYAYSGRASPKPLTIDAKGSSLRNPFFPD